MASGGKASTAAAQPVGDAVASGSGSRSTQAAAKTLMDAPRHGFARGLLGDDVYSQLAHAKILVVGAGGIGCELLKNLVLVGVGHIDIIDLDTIDLSNLNRQFLFSKQHIGKPKSLVAAATASQFNPLVSITPHHGNIKDTSQFGWEYFAQFDVVCNALDNLDARRWVNKMCIMTGVPLVESGTTGFKGQVQPIIRNVSECYDCVEKETPKTYPVCTIRSTPSTPIHCIVWAKTWLFTQLFGAADENEDAELDKALQDGENADEIANLRKEAQEMRSLRDAAFTLGKDASAEQVASLCQRVFNKIFRDDVLRLLSMEEMWRKRTKPVPIDYEEAQKEGDANGNGVAANGSTLRDQRILTLHETAAGFARSLTNLARRASALGNTASASLSFDKDDDDAMDFVTAASNLRSRVYHISSQSRFQAKEMAGNIIPAIASTNAIIAGAQVLQTLQTLRRTWSQTRVVTLNRNSASKQYVSSFSLGKPSPACGVCQDDYVRAVVDVDIVTLAQLKGAVQAPRPDAVDEAGDGGGSSADHCGSLGFDVEGMEIYEGARLLADEDFDDNLPRTLRDMGIEPGKTVTCVDEDGVRANVNVYIAQASIDPAAAEGAEPAALPVDFGPLAKMPVLRNRPANPKREREEIDSLVPAAASNGAAVHDSDDDDIVVVDPSEIAAAAAQSAANAAKRKRLDDDGSAGLQKVNGDVTGPNSKRIRPLPANEPRGNHEDDAIELD